MLRKATLLSAVAGAALFASTASADVTVIGNVTKLVDIDIVELIVKRKAVTLVVRITDVPEKAAEAQTIFNQRNEGNEACENCAEKTDLISGSVRNNVGITSVNQSSGNSNNQGTVISFAFDLDTPQDPPGGNTGFAEAQVAGAQYMQGNRISSVAIIFREALILNSIVGNSGITAVNQATGNINNQANAISIAFSQSNGVALSDVALGQFNTGNTVAEGNGVNKIASINTSITGNVGITQVNQTAGNFANQANVVSIAATGF